MYTYPNNAKAQLDNILINRKWINSSLNYEAYSSFKEVSSDQRINTAKICHSLYRNKKQMVKTTHYNWSQSTNRDSSNKYTVIVRNKFDTFQLISETHTPNDEYEILSLFTW